MNCLVCGKEIPEGETIDDCLIVQYLNEEGQWYRGYVFVCSYRPCFETLKQRIFKDNKGRSLLFNQ